MRTKQLNIWTSKYLRDYVARQAEDGKHHMNVILVDLIKDGIVKRNEQLVFMKLPIKMLWR